MTRALLALLLLGCSGPAPLADDAWDPEPAPAPTQEQPEPTAAGTGGAPDAPTQPQAGQPSPGGAGAGGAPTTGGAGQGGLGGQPQETTTAGAAGQPSGPPCCSNHTNAIGQCLRDSSPACLVEDGRGAELCADGEDYGEPSDGRPYGECCRRESLSRQQGAPAAGFDAYEVCRGADQQQRCHVRRAFAATGQTTTCEVPDDGGATPECDLEGTTCEQR